MFTRRTILALTALALTTASRPAVAAQKPKVVTTFSILADVARNVGGERIDVVSLVGANGDSHVYSPTPTDAKTLAAADIVVASGLGFEGWMERLVKASGTKATAVVASTGVKPREKAGGQDHAHAKEHDHDHGHAGKADPHVWQSIANVKIYATNIRDALVKADPAGQAAYEANTTAYLAKLTALEAEVKDAVARIPAGRRKVIVTHNAFGYFQDAYGVEFVPVQGVSTESEASAGDVARIVSQIKKQNIAAVFLENVSDPRLIERIGKETGAKIGGTLYSDALTDDKGEAPTYIDLIRHNVRQLATALASS